jgi:RNA polymerase sigma factor (sigma-70 family)
MADDETEPGSVTLMIHQLCSDDPLLRDEAARVVWERYFHDLLALARRHLSQKVRTRLDEEDVLQSVYDSVCRRQRQGEFDLFGRDDLWKLLVTITLRKARNAARWHTREKRDVHREAPQPGPDTSLEGTSPLERLPAFAPTPDEAVALAEEFQTRIDALPDALLRQVALRKLEGFSNREIAAELTCAERSVERKLALIRRLWEHESTDAP